MQIFTFNCANSRLRRYTSGLIYAGSYPNVIFKFNFNTPDWDSVQTKTAVFSYRGNNHNVDLDENNMCRVPKEVLYAGAFHVSVQGGAVPTNSVRVPVTDKDVSGTSTYEEIIKRIETHTHDEYIEEKDIEKILPDTFDAGAIIERS